jgi:bifunctional ADP-heptose synthase (sugar kinase/adenylyltransferase)
MWQRNRLKVGLILDVFDEITAQDLERLEKARAGCDRLVIAIPKDDSARQDQRTRAYVLASLVFSDAVLVTNEKSAQHLLSALNPDVLIP